MDGGISKIRSGTPGPRPDRVGPRKEREREEQTDFAEEFEHRSHDEAHHDDAPVDPSTGPSPAPRPALEPLDTGYPTEDESGGSLDIVA